MEMMQAPTPFTELINPFKVINTNELKTKEIYKFNEYNLTIGLLEDNIIFDVSINGNIFQILKNYDSMIKEIPNFKLSNDINSIYNLLIQLFNSDRYEIQNKDKNAVKIIIKLKDILGNDELYDIVLYQIKLDNKNKYEQMEKKILTLENKVEEIKNENIEIKKKLNELYELYNENKILKSEIQNLKVDKNNHILSLCKESKIIKEENKINFVIEEIEKVTNSISETKLLYRATRDGSSIEEFHSRCDNYPNTLMLVQTTKGYIFGGFTSVGWISKNGANIQDKNAFCFSINLNKIYNIIKPENAMHLQSNDCRPSFGVNKYVFILQQNFLASTENYVEKMTDYKGEKKALEINGGNKKFGINELEVFQII